MATANHVLIQRTTLTAASSSVTLSSIPQTGYTDLKIVISARCTTTGYYSGYQQAMYAQFNSSSSSYSHRWLQGENGTNVNSGTNYFTAGTSYAPVGTVPTSGWTASSFSNTELYIPSYTSSNYKSYSVDSIAENNSGTYWNNIMFAGLWSNTAAITSIVFSLASGSFEIGSSFAIYGIANAIAIPVSAPKADGGDIIKTDGTYWYHAFLSTGSFKPQLNLTCDVLVVAGGGGGGGNGGGGGAGGLLVFTSQAVSAASATIVTVGAGGAAGTSSTQGFQGTNSQFGSLTASIGGGDGNTQSSPWTYGTGGSGGGGGSGVSTGRAGTAGQGYAGGNATISSPYPNGGGGGAGAIGGNGTGSTGGAGGVGFTSSLTNAMGSATATGQLVSSNYYYAGGGGGCVNSGTGGVGGNGGGGTGTNVLTGGAAPSGSYATGGGGAGGGGSSDSYRGGQGGSGIIIIRYPV